MAGTMTVTRALEDAAQTIAAAHAPGESIPVLATPGQIFAEKLALEIVEEPTFRAARDALLEKLRNHPNSQTPDGAATLPNAVTLWAMNLIFQEVGNLISPAFLITADDTPHAWYGNDFPGAGISGDNPDNTYRVVYLDGGLNYEIKAKLPENRAPQLTFNLTRVLKGGGATGANTTDLGNQITHRTDEAIEIAPDGSFTLTVGPEPGSGNHMTSEPGRIGLWIRDSRSDWRQMPMQLSVRCLDPQPERPAPTAASLGPEIATQLGEFCELWASFRMGYLGRPPVNTLVGPIGRNGQWGFLAGGRFDLADDQAIVAEIDPQGSRYFSVHLTDPWAMVLDARTTISARNNAQTTLNPDGSATYVISPRDPGVPNWISPAELHQGEIRFRWQKTPHGFDPDRVIRSYRLVQFNDLATELPGQVGKIADDQRHKELARRAAEYDLRWTA